MKMYMDCILCFVRQSLEVARYLGADELTQERVMKRVLAEGAKLEMRLPPPLSGQMVHRIIREELGQADPYLEQKDRFDRMAMGMEEEYREKIRRAANPLETAVKLAIAGNIIDFGIGLVGDGHLHEAIEHALATAIDPRIMKRFEREARGARDILYLADNTGEIVFDKLLIELLGPEKVTLAVKAGPIINDVTRREAEMVGLAAMVEVIDNGTDAPGTPLAQCSREFLERFESAALIVSKGQGHYETLSEEGGRPIWFLLKAKCSVVAEHLGVPMGAVICQPIGRRL